MISFICEIQRTKYMNEQNVNRLIETVRETGGCQRAGDLKDWVKEVKGLRNTNG